MGNKELHEITGGDKGLQGGDKGLQVMTGGGDKELQAMTSNYRG